MNDLGLASSASGGRPREQPGSGGAAEARDPSRLGWWRAALVAAVALGLRVAYLGHAALDPSFFTPWLDARGYLQWAQDIAAGTLTSPQPFFHAPLYPYVLAVLLLLGRGSLVFVRVAQAAIGAATAALTGALGARLFGRTVGMVAGLACALAASLVLFDLELLSEVVFVPLCIGALLALERATRDPAPARLLAAGAMLGLAAIARPNVLLFAPVALVWCVAALRGRGWRIAGLARGGLLFAAGVALPILPVTLENRLAGGDLVLVSSQAGVNLYLGNGPTADGWSAHSLGPVDTPPYDEHGRFTDNIMSSARFVADRAEARALRPSEVSRFWSRRARAWIAAHPAAWAGLLARKAFYLTAGFEVGDNKNLAALFDDWPPFRFLPRWWWLFPLAVAGLTVPGARRGRALLASYLVALGASVVAFLVVERFRLALYPVLAILAARLVAWAPGAWRERRRTAVLARVGLALALAAWTRWDPTGYTVPQRVEARVVRAGASEARGDTAGAERLYLDALEVDPSSPSARQAYGGFLLRRGRLGEARPYAAAPR